MKNIKRLLCVILSALTLISIISCGLISVNAATESIFGKDHEITFGTTYEYTYRDNNCRGTFVVPENGIVKVSMEKPLTYYGQEIDFKIELKKNYTTLIDKYLKDDVFYLFLAPGTYTINFIDVYNDAQKPLKYTLTFEKSNNNIVNSVKFGETYDYFYNSYDCYGSLSLSEAGTVVFDLTQPTSIDGTGKDSYISIVNVDEPLKEIAREDFIAGDESNIQCKIKLNAGKYKFNYRCKSVYSEDSKIYVDCEKAIRSSYKVTFEKPAGPDSPTIKHNVVSNKKVNNITVTFDDNNMYDGVELWIKKDNDKWKKESSYVNTKDVRCTSFNLALNNTDNYIGFYKVRAYTDFFGDIKYSDYSNVLHTKTSLKLETPKIVSATSTTKKTAKVEWKKSDNVKGYEVLRSTAKNKGYKKAATINKPEKTSYLNKKLTSGKTYFYKIRSYKKINGVKIYSNYSSVKSVKIK